MPGVGGYMPVLRYAEADNGSVEDAIAAAPLSLTNFPGESEMDAYCVVVSAVDALGNESGLPDEDDGMCLIAGVPLSRRTDDDNNSNDATGSYEDVARGPRHRQQLRPPTTATATDKGRRRHSCPRMH